jgi:4-diphosphocytidyl-2C-methyl-D-erythritol kinase
MLSDAIIMSLLVFINLNSLLIGYILGQRTGGVYQLDQLQHKKNNQTINKKQESISIDDKKFVVDINTNDLEKKYTKLGDSVQTTDNISGSVNKLKNLKG